MPEPAPSAVGLAGAADIEAFRACAAPFLKTLTHLLEHHDDKIVNFATERYIAFPPDTKIRDVLEQYRAVAKKRGYRMRFATPFSPRTCSHDQGRYDPVELRPTTAGGHWRVPGQREAKRA